MGECVWVRRLYRSGDEGGEGKESEVGWMSVDRFRQRMGGRRNPGNGRKLVAIDALGGEGREGIEVVGYELR